MTTTKMKTKIRYLILIAANAECHDSFTSERLEQESRGGRGRLETTASANPSKRESIKKKDRNNMRT